MESLASNPNILIDLEKQVTNKNNYVIKCYLFNNIQRTEIYCVCQCNRILKLKVGTVRLNYDYQFFTAIIFSELG